MSKKLEIRMDEPRFTSESNTVLKTSGITTCIVFIVYGEFWDDDDELVTFCGLYHWSGFTEKNNHVDQVKNTISSFLGKIREFAGIDDDDEKKAKEEIILTSLQFIGGQKAQFDQNGKSILSGTEAEVATLEQVLKTFNFAEQNFDTRTMSITHNHYLTASEDSLSIELSLKGLKVQKVLAQQSVAPMEEVRRTPK